MGDFLHELDPGLPCYIDEFNKLSVTSLVILKYLRSHEIKTMAIPEVYKRFLLDKVAVRNRNLIMRRRLFDDGEYIDRFQRNVRQ